MTVAGSAASLTKAINDTVKELAVTQASMNTKVTAIQANQATAATQKTTAEGYRDTAATNATSAAASLATVKSTVVMDGIPAVSGSKMGTAVDTFIYDTSLDSDGGAWRKKCQHTSWFNETITGKWLGAHVSEFQARHGGATLGAELVAYGGFNNSSAWTLGSGWAIANGVATHDTTSGYLRMSQLNLLTVGKLYLIEFQVVSKTSGQVFVGGSGSGYVIASAAGFYSAVVVAAETVLYVTSENFVGSIDNISVREVTALTTSPNDYFQLTTDGKFYKLNSVSGITEVFRGNRREFPAVALIVAEANKVTIYDADDLTLPMWIVFNVAAGNTIWRTVNSLVMRDAKLVVGANSGGYGVSRIDFIKETAVAYAGANYNLNTGNRISGRNSNGGYILAPDGQAIISADVNDVAMTVLPNAPIDAATGLPVPTIAVGTLGGVSILKQDGSIVNDSTLAYSPDTRSVKFDADGVLWITAAGNHHFRWDSPYASSGAAEIGESVLGGTLTQWTGWVAGNKDFLPMSLSKRALPHLQGLTLFDTNRHLYMTASYITGWMPASTRGAWLASKDTTSLVGTELVTNGGFDTNSNWTLASGYPVTIADGVVSWLSNANVTQVSPITLKVGMVFRVSFDITSYTSGYVYAFVAGAIQNASQNGNIVGSYSFEVTINNVVNQTFGVISGNSPNHSVDNVSIKMIEPDRSVNNKGLTVNGTIPRAAVAAGAELVSYHPYGADFPQGTGTNYLYQAPSANLRFGTADFSVMGWVYPESDGNNFVLCQWGYGEGSQTHTWSFIRWAGGLYHFGLKINGTTETVASETVAGLNKWMHVVGVRRGNQLQLYVDGVLKKDVAASGFNFVSTTADLRFGGGTYGGAKSALWRISATAPTTDQIKKIYDDEVRLFQPGAACTLFGTSDAVTALAHDPKTNLMHVGTSSGRSVFDGLVRVANTTTPVTTAISAVNGLIAEQ